MDIITATEDKKIMLGYRGENVARQVVFDLSELISTFGAGVAVLMVKRSEFEDAYPASDVVQDGNTLTWTLTVVDTEIAGACRAELFWYVDSLLAKTVVYRTYVAADIGTAQGEAPDAYETWVDTLTSLGAETLANAQAAQAAQTGAETAQGLAEDAQEAAEDAQEAAELAQSGAEDARDTAEAQALKAEGYAVGTQDGTAVGSGSPYYENNAEYYSDLAAQVASEAGYVTFHIDNDGHLIFTKTTTTDLGFRLENGHLILEVA